jgi:hypothetical protein
MRKRFDFVGYYLESTRTPQPSVLCDARSVDISNRHNHKPDNAASLGTCQKTMSSMRRKQARSRIFQWEWNAQNGGMGHGSACERPENWSILPIISRTRLTVLPRRVRNVEKLSVRKQSSELLPFPDLAHIIAILTRYKSSKHRFCELASMEFRL